MITQPELAAVLRIHAGETCLACGHANAPRVDEIPFCSSCVEAGWAEAYTRGANAAFVAMAAFAAAGEALSTPRHEHAGEVTIDRATGGETCDDCDPALKNPA